MLAASWFGVDFPYGTFIVNLVGSFIIGLVQEIGTDALLIPDTVRIFLTTGIKGGLTTYSSFSYETVRLMKPTRGRRRGSTSSRRPRCA